MEFNFKLPELQADILNTMKSIWNDKVIAESDDNVNAEENANFPVEA